MMSKAAQKQFRLDRLVGEKLMGFRLKKERKKYGNPPWGYRLERKGGHPVGRQTGFFGWGWEHTEDAAWFSCPNYSTDIAAAWDVWALMAQSSISFFNGFLTQICVLARTMVIPEALMRLTPEIICKAALQVKGVSLKKLAI